VVVDRPGRLLVDYHTVIGGVLSAEGIIKITQSTKERETVVSHRAYLADASFLAALHGPEETVARAAVALQAPVWPPFLGRRSCPPAAPFFAGTGDFASLEEALRSQPLAEGTQGHRVRAVIERPPGRGVRRNDQIESLARRTYLPRYASDVLLDITAGDEE
jgi:CRISPR system Cascade subunit CasD